MSSLDKVAKGIGELAVAELERTSGTDDLPEELRTRAIRAAQDLALAQLQRLAGESTAEAERTAQASLANLSAGMSVVAARALVGAVQRVLIDGIQKFALAAL